MYGDGCGVRSILKKKSCCNSRKNQIFSYKNAYFLVIFCDKFCLFVDVKFFLKIIYSLHVASWLKSEVTKKKVPPTPVKCENSNI